MTEQQYTLTKQEEDFRFLGIHPVTGRPLPRRPNGTLPKEDFIKLTRPCLENELKNLHTEEKPPHGNEETSTRETKNLHTEKGKTSTLSSSLCTSLSSSTLTFSSDEEESNLSNLQKKEIILKSIKEGKTTRELFDEKPLIFISNLCTYFFNEDKAKEQVEEILEKLNFDILFGDVKSFVKGYSSWISYFNWVWERNRIAWKKPCSGVYLFLFIRKLKMIPDEEREIKTKNQTIQIKEMAYVLKEITRKVLSGNGSCMLARNYFLCESSKDSYYEQTKRKINSHKIGHILKLLAKYNFIAPFEKSSPGEYKPHTFKLGQENYYYDDKRNKVEKGILDDYF